jgi:hypothetical protein
MQTQSMKTFLNVIQNRNFVFSFIFWSFLAQIFVRKSNIIQVLIKNNGVIKKTVIQFITA